MEGSKQFNYNDQQITDLVHKFFSQTSDERLKYMRMLKELLENKLKNKFNEVLKAQNGDLAETLSPTIKENEDADNDGSD